MWHILKEYEILEKLISLIKACYVDSRSAVKGGGKKLKNLKLLAE